MGMEESDYEPGSGVVGSDPNLCVNCRKPIFRGKFTSTDTSELAEPRRAELITWRHTETGYEICGVGLKTHATPPGGVSLNLEHLGTHDFGFTPIPPQMSEEFEPSGIAPFAYTAEDAPMPVTPGFDRTLTYYLSGPMKGIPEHNWPAFQAACDVLRRTGIQVVSPHEVNPAANVDPIATDPTKYPLNYLTDDIKEMLAKCQGLILLRGWPRSRGGWVELGLAVNLEWPIWYYDNYQLINMNRE